MEKCPLQRQKRFLSLIKIPSEFPSFLPKLKNELEMRKGAETTGLKGDIKRVTGLFLLE